MKLSPKTLRDGSPLVAAALVVTMLCDFDPMIKIAVSAVAVAWFALMVWDLFHDAE